LYFLFIFEQPIPQGSLSCAKAQFTSRTNQKAALYKLLVPFAILLKRGEKFFRLSLLQQQDFGAA